MRSAFSNYLLNRRISIESAKQRKKVPLSHLSIVEEIQLLKSCDYLPQLMLNDSLNDKIAESVTYKICTNQELRRIITWVTKNILHNFRKDCQETRWVKIRIATDMLNKCVYNGTIDKCEGIYMHDNLVNNLTDLINDIWEEQMPFLATA